MIPGVVISISLISCERGRCVPKIPEDQKQQANQLLAIWLKKQCMRTDWCSHDPSDSGPRTPHHQHQLGQPLAIWLQESRVIGVSRVSCERSDPKHPASSASVGSAANDLIPRTGHHQHHLAQPRMMWLKDQQHQAN